MSRLKFDTFTERVSVMPPASRLRGIPLNILEYGADPTGSDDSSSAVIDALSDAAGGPIYAPEGTYLVDDQITDSERFNGPTIRGAGKNKTIFQGTSGMSGASPFKFTNCVSPTLEDFSIYGTTGSPLLAGIEVTANNPTGQYQSSNLHVARVYFGGTNSAGLTNGIKWTDTTDSGNDQAVIIDCDFNNLTTAFNIAGTNSLGHRFISCDIGSTVTNSVVLAGGSFTALGGLWQSTGGWIVDLGAGTYEHVSQLIGVVWEGTGAWFRSNSACTTFPHLDLLGCSIVGGTASTLTIDWQAPGHFLVVGGEMLTGQASTSAHFTSSDARAWAVFENVGLGLTDFTYNSPLTFRQVNHEVGSITFVNSGAGTLTEDVVTGASRSFTGYQAGLWRHFIDAFEPPKSTSSAVWGITDVTGRAIIFQAAGASNGDHLDYDVVLSAGTWSLTLTYLQVGAGGIVQPKLDDGAGNFSDLGSGIDTYAAATSYDNQTTVTGISVAAGIRRTLRLTMNGKNASSAGYNLDLQGIALVRTA